MGELNRRYFEALMSDKRMSLRALAAQMGMGHSQLSLTFSGARKLQLDEAAQLSNIFGVPIHEIVENAGVLVRSNSGRRVSVVGAMRGDGTVEMYGPDVVERTAAPGDLPDDALAVQCRTAGSMLDYVDGWVVFFRQPGGVAPDALGRFCFCKIKDGPMTLATVRRGYSNGHHNLTGFVSRENVTLEHASPILLIRP